METAETTLVQDTAVRAIQAIETELANIAEAVKSPRVNKEKVMLSIERCKPALNNLWVVHPRRETFHEALQKRTEGGSI